MQTARPILDLRGKLIATYIAYEIAAELDLVDVGDPIGIVTDGHSAIEHDLRAWAGATRHRIVDAQPTSEGRRSPSREGPDPTPPARWRW